MIRRVTSRLHDDENDRTLLRLECGHVVESISGASHVRCAECARHRDQDLLRGRFGRYFRALVDRNVAAGALAAQERMNL